MPRDVLEQAKATFQKLGLRALVVVGGDGSLSIAQQLLECGVPLVGVPKTIDNDLEATAFTFGFDSAVACATDALDRLRTTAQSHERVMVLEVMGRYAGWIAVHSGISGGGDVILIPEIPYSTEKIADAILTRVRGEKRFSIVCVAEGALSIAQAEEARRKVEAKSKAKAVSHAESQTDGDGKKKRKGKSENAKKKKKRKSRVKPLSLPIVQKANF